MELFRKVFLIYVLMFLSYFCYAQKRKVFSAGISTDCGFGKELNNFSSTAKLRYYLFDNFRIAPSFSFYFPKEDSRMNAFAFNFHYLFPGLAADIFLSDRKGIVFYPVAGFYIANAAKGKRVCSTCSTNAVASNYSYYFGFDFGAGLDYDLPTSAPVWQDMTANFEIQYQAVENYRRPQLSLGLIYNF
ncbi:MAG: hypothetical protein LBS79_09740 [Tannerella sp.]|jgi:hypothetical protein|nr:hypothetical protein [Tannerella sp.]